MSKPLCSVTVRAGDEGGSSWRSARREDDAGRRGPPLTTRGPREGGSDAWRSKDSEKRDEPMRRGGDDRRGGEERRTAAATPSREKRKMHL